MFSFQTNSKWHIKGARKERLSKYLNPQVTVRAVKAVVWHQFVNPEKMQASYQKRYHPRKRYWFPSLVKRMQLDTTISLSSFTARSCIRQGQWLKVFSVLQNAMKLQKRKILSRRKIVSLDFSLQKVTVIRLPKAHKARKEDIFFHISRPKCKTTIIQNQS